MADAARKILVIGFGNPGRLDDGLGPALAAAVTEWQLPGVTVESNYQLTVEDAAQVAEHEVVVFADAHVSCPEPFELSRVEPVSQPSFTTHEVDPPTVMALARDLFQARTEAYLLAVRGYEFNEFGEVLSLRAVANLKEALQFLRPRLESGQLAAPAG